MLSAQPRPTRFGWSPKPARLATDNQLERNAIKLMSPRGLSMGKTRALPLKQSHPTLHRHDQKEWDNLIDVFFFL